MASMGAYRRRIELVTRSPSVVEGEVEDDFHHFRVSIAHEDGTVVAVDGETPRHPWSTCPDALAPLRALVGAPVTTDATAIGEHTDPRTTCTHWFDLAGLVIAQAGAGRDHRRYDIEIPDRDRKGRTTAHLARDGEPILDWDVGAQDVLGPDPYTGQAMGRGFLAWANATLDPDTAEAAIVLRRGCRTSLGLLMDLDDYERASEIGHGMENTCHTFSTSVMDVAFRMKGSTRLS
jgi:Protein of unknown function (DUF2889)